MSSFLVSRELISRIATFIVREQGGRSSIGRACSRQFPGELDNESLQRELWEMNVAALRQRYGDDAGVYEFSPIYVPQPVNLFALAKDMDCLLYQCREGDVPQTALYKAMQEVRNALCLYLVRSQPEYDRADWG